MRKLQAKFSVWNVEKHEGNYPREQVTLGVVYGPEAGEWAKATPSGNMHLTVDNPVAHGFFKKEATYLVTIEESSLGYNDTKIS